MKCWCTAPDGSIKPSNLLPSAKELLDIYIDHVWMPMQTHATASAAAMSQYRMLALVDPDPNNEINRNRRQCVYVLDGKEQVVGSNSSSSSTAANVPLAMELRQTLMLKLESGVRAEKIIVSGKGFLLIGDHGLILMYDRTDDKSEPFVETKRLSLGRMHLAGATVYPAEDKMVVLTKSNRLLTLAMDVQAEQLTKTLAKHEQQHHGNQAGGGSKGLMKHHHHHHTSDGDHASAMVGHHSVISDLTKGGYHPSEILSADFALERPLMMTIGKDGLARVWNYTTGRCEIVHAFSPTEEASVCALHPNGLHAVVALKDRIRMYNMLLDKLRPAKETVLKNVRALKYAHGAQYIAIAASISVYVYDTRTLTPLATYTAHLQPVTRLAWADGDQILFSGGMDGNVYGWPIAFGGANEAGGAGAGSGSGGHHHHHHGNFGRIEVITATNRSAPIHDLVVDARSTVFRDPSSMHASSTGNGADDGTTNSSNSNSNNNNSNNSNNNNSANDASGIVATTGGDNATAGSNHHSWLQWMNYARSLVIVTSRDGHVRMPSWALTPGGAGVSGGKANKGGDNDDLLLLPSSSSAVGVAANANAAMASSSSSSNNNNNNNNATTTTTTANYNNNSSNGINNAGNTTTNNNNNNNNGGTVAVASAGFNPTGRYPTIDGVPTLFGDVSISITAVCLAPDRTKLFAGTSVGSIRVYAWPPDPQFFPLHAQQSNSTNAAAAPLALPTTYGAAGNVGNGTNGTNGTNTSGMNLAMSMFQHLHLCYEVYTHKEAVIAIGVGARPNLVLSAAADGSVFMQQLSDERPFAVRRAQAALSSPKASSSTSAAAFDPFEDDVEEASKKLLNDDIVLLASEDVEEHVNQVVELQKLLTETRAQNEFHARKLEVEHNDHLKKITDAHESALQKERDVFERQRNNYESRIRDLMASIESKDADHAKIVTQMENQYEHRLADQIMRYDLLSEKMQLLKQKCEGLVENERDKFAAQLSSLRSEHATTIKRMQGENRRAIEEKATNENAYKQIIGQQEEEYEDELRALITAAEKELVSERELVTRLRTAMAEKQTQYDHLKKKFEELQRASRARMELLAKETAEKKKHMDTIEHYKKNLAEREEALAEKEKVVLELRSKTRTLENFRFVLDHRLQQLSSERGPITSHIEGLEKHIATMYEEMVDEFAAKKASAEANQLKDQKISWLSQDLNKLRATVREKEQYIAGFKREVGNIVTSMIVGKELEESIHSLYKKFVKGEGDDGNANNQPGNNGHNSTNNHGNGTNNNNNNNHSSSSTTMKAKQTIDRRQGSAGGGGVRMSAKAQEVIADLLHGAPGHALLKNTLGGGNNAHQHYHNGNSSNNNNNNNSNPLANHPEMMADDQSFMSVDTGLVGHHHGLHHHGVGHSKALIREVEEALVDTAKEAARQMDHLEDRANKLKKRLRVTQKEATITSRHRLHENSDLLFECNDLRAENKELNRKIGVLRHDLEMLQRQQAFLRTGTSPPRAPSAAAAAAAAASRHPQQHHQQQDEAGGGGGDDGVEALEMYLQHPTTEIAPWVVHSGLRGSHQPLLAPSQSSPVLSLQQQQQSRQPKQHNHHNNNNKLSASMSALPTAINNHNVAAAAGGSSSTKAVQMPNVLLSKQIERLNAAVESLAQQLDEANREKDMQRLELTKLRKLLAQQQILHSGSGSLHQSSPSVHKLPSLHQPNGNNNNSNSNNNQAPQLQSSLIGSNHPSVFSSASTGSQPIHASKEGLSLTHADVTGQPSEQDRLNMRLTPQGSQVSAGQLHKKGSKNASTASASSLLDKHNAGKPPKSGGLENRLGGATNTLSHEFSLNSHHEGPRGE
jgi:hypothetical protein